ncbi:hypothetical protein DNH61_12560 [Paenibacillus sambharensis]|uniref:Uncharacterized protein n=1 Tax=Paenibacillus sambharensis TaxID=1803190 RepID=A0A2W1L5H3_9BACL|nr:hypothetical protein [Paenibacillus sambharensis]PZD95368.1 hypothetical protein DNH61_12560 [Paenibacillus sambharensis]
MKYIRDFALAIALTAASYYMGTLLVSGGINWWEALLIGITVVSLGAITEGLNAPIWLIILVPFPVGMLLLYFFLNTTVIMWFSTYLMTLLIYTLIHMLVSYSFQFHSLIPAWKLRTNPSAR